ncbi:zinc ribbon domain-containing protein [Ottowia sp. GY511]|uniref:FmdB family zinc ribbon protein n=1 Tax=Ottowia flava TaxID=2675430 RepID=A0ABW4KVD1_9BURK|nr:FmdB family zinc ribbon protein [Ottowia sp. GY511]TXK31418.1 zinc ribbon domain-containing protein [Ottowia sp. GY511]
MPIYAYKCASCGFAKDALQKLSDPPLTVCPSCGKPDFAKQVTAAGFQLKGSGWYVTDFRDGNKGGAAKAPASDSGSDAGAAPAPAPAASPAPAPAASSPAPAPAPAPAPSGSVGSSSGTSGG